MTSSEAKPLFHRASAAPLLGREGRQQAGVYAAEAYPIDNQNHFQLIPLRSGLPPLFAREGGWGGELARPWLTHPAQAFIKASAAPLLGREGRQQAGVYAAEAYPIDNQNHFQLYPSGVGSPLSSQERGAGGVS
jgi:hypothetical protein